MIEKLGGGGTGVVDKAQDTREKNWDFGSKDVTHGRG